MSLSKGVSWIVVAGVLAVGCAASGVSDDLTGDDDAGTPHTDGGHEAAPGFDGALPETGGGNADAGTDAEPEGDAEIDTSAPDTSTPDASVPDTSVPDTSVPDT